MPNQEIAKPNIVLKINLDLTEVQSAFFATQKLVAQTRWGYNPLGLLAGLEIFWYRLFERLGLNTDNFAPTALHKKMVLKLQGGGKNAQL